MGKGTRRSYFLFRPRKGERQRMASRLSGELRAGMKYLKDEETIRRFADTETAQHLLSDLVSETAKLLSDLGLDVPETADGCRAEIDRRGPFVSIAEKLAKGKVKPIEHFLAGTEEQRALVEAAVVEGVIGLIDSMSDPGFTALHAYEGFKRAEEALEAGCAIEAVAYVSGGAVYLARACTTRAGQMSSDGGKSRSETNDKAKAMREIKDEWETMRAGRSKQRSDARFAREMIAKHPIIENEGSIKNAIVRWRKNQSSC